MDVASTALTAAWLDAVRRVQSERVQNIEKLMPQDGKGDGLTAAIEGGLKSGGAAPLNPSDATDKNPVDKRPPVHIVDVLV